jgi:hypothetical protein
MWGVSTATAGALAASLFVVLLYPGEQETQEFSAGSTVESRSPVRELATQVRAEEWPRPSVAPRALASIPARSPRVSTVALGPVQVEDPLSPAWSQQVQAGPLDSSDPVLSLWRQAASR